MRGARGGVTAMVLALTTALVVSGAGSPARTSGSKTFTISALRSHWLDTGLRLGASGHGAVKVLSNDATCHMPSASDCPVGASSGYTCSSNPVVGSVPEGPAGDTVPYGQLAGKVGAGGKPFAIKSSTSVSGPGELYLVYNDCAPPAGYSDNGGSVKVSISGFKEQPTLALTVSAPVKVDEGKAVIDVGEIFDVTVRVSAAGGSFKDVFLTGGGLQLTTCKGKTSSLAVVTSAPPEASGFPLADGATRTFVFKMRGKHNGTAVLGVTARGETADGDTIRDSGATELEVGSLLTTGGADPGLQTSCSILSGANGANGPAPGN